jgi:hypothetical protein
VPDQVIKQLETFVTGSLDEHTTAVLPFPTKPTNQPDPPTEVPRDHPHR